MRKHVGLTESNTPQALFCTGCANPHLCLVFIIALSHPEVFTVDTLSGFPTWILVLSPHLRSLIKSHSILHFLSFCDLTLPQPDKTNLLLPSSAHRKKTKKTCLLPHGKSRAPTFSASAEGNLCRRCGIVAPWRHCPGAAPHIF